MNAKLASRLTVAIVLIFTLALLLTINTLNVTASTSFQTIPQSTSTPPPNLTQIRQPIQYSPISFVMVLLLIALLGVLFYFLFLWSGKLDQASYLGTLYRDTIRDIEYKRLMADILEKRNNRYYYRTVVEDPDWIKEHEFPEPPKDLNPDEEKRLRTENLYAFDKGWDYGTSPSDGWGTANAFVPNVEQSQEEIDKKRREDDALHSHIQNIAKWKNQVDTEAKARYAKDVSDARNTAYQRATQAINIDFSVLRGRGAEFVLEFTTVVVIIFAAVILGILGILDTQQIGTLLAAIAGYVLGRATTRSRSDGAVMTTGNNSSDASSK